MSAIRRFFTGVTSTGENMQDDTLRTRFFRTEQKKVCREVVSWAEQDKNIRIVHTSEERGEIVLECRNALGMIHDVVVTVFAITPIQSAVDVHAALRATFVDFGFNRKIIQRLYSYLEKKLPAVNNG